MSELASETPGEGGDIPEVADDNSPEDQRVPEPEEPALPSDSPLGVDAPGTTVAEQLEGESLDEKLARERNEG